MTSDFAPAPVDGFDITQFAWWPGGFVARAAELAESRSLSCGETPQAPRPVIYQFSCTTCRIRLVDLMSKTDSFSAPISEGCKPIVQLRARHGKL